MTKATAVIERCLQTGLLSAYIPGISGAYTQGESIEELRHNLIEVLELLHEEGQIQSESEFVGTELVEVP